LELYSTRIKNYLFIPRFVTIHIFRRGKAELFSVENRKSPRTLPPAQRSSEGRADGIRIIVSSEAGSGCSRSKIFQKAINVPAAVEYALIENHTVSGFSK
jgi:hypothetical protein